MEIVGVTVDVRVTNLDRVSPFYTALLGRAPDLRPDPDTLEWRLVRRPEVALRVIRARDVPAGNDRVGLGVPDLASERSRLAALLPGLPEPTVRPGVIATCVIGDPDGNVVVLWQDLLPVRGRQDGAGPTTRTGSGGGVDG